VNEEEKHSLLPVLLRVCLVDLGLVSIQIPSSESVAGFVSQSWLSVLTEYSNDLLFSGRIIADFSALKCMTYNGASYML
jgi:hypothetical protein